MIRSNLNINEGAFSHSSISTHTYPALNNVNVKDKQIEMFNCEHSNKNIADNISEADLFESKERERTKKILKTVGLVTLGIGIVVGTALLLKKYQSKQAVENLIVNENCISGENGLSGKIIEASEYNKVKAIKCMQGSPQGLYVTAPDCVTQSRFNAVLNPQEMEIATGRFKTLHICTDGYPYCGSAAISSTLDQAISTGGLMTCAGVGFVDKSNNIQTLLHCNSNIDPKKNRAILEYILANKTPENMEIYMVPGVYAGTDNTIDFLVKNIKDINKNFKINFLNFKDSNHSIVILNNGKIISGDASNIIVKAENPMDRLIFTKSN